ncbi:MAG: hypothetical protein KatS3mg090_0067 [Patescibacteria group bacterium]|nr:MAG: hypothetical protein KatS3mg090_0067 [Patescibacteria group bacterium]
MLRAVRRYFLGLSNIFTVVLLLIVFFVVLNLLAGIFNFKLDLSKDKIYTLSPATYNVLKNVDDVIQIKFIASSNIPKQFMPLKDRVLGLLQEYKKANPNVTVEVLDPDKDSTAEKLVSQQGLPQLQFTEQKSGQLSLSNAYFGIIIQYLDKSEIIPQVLSVEGLEYDITSAIYRLVNKDLPEVGVVGYESSFANQNSSITNLDSVLRKQFLVTYPQLEDADLSRTKLLFIIDDGQKSYSTSEAKIITDYINKKGNAIIIADGVWVSDATLTTTPANHNLNEVLKNFGLEIEPNLILSNSAELVNFGGGQLSLVLPYRFWVKTNVFNPDKSIFNNINTLTYPWVSSIKVKDNSIVEPLVKTTNQSWAQTNEFNLSPETAADPVPEETQSFVVSALAEKKSAGKVAVISSRRFVLDQFQSQNDNLNFISNLALSLTNNQLAGIRNKSAGVYILPVYSYPFSEILKYSLIFLFPALFLILGVVKAVRR